MKKFIKEIYSYVLIVVFVILFRSYIATPVRVDGDSMNDTLINNDILILNKFHYRFFDIKRFDVVSLEYDDTKYLIKRVIGLPGDKVEYKNNVLYINGDVVEEEFLNDDVITNDFGVADLGYDVIPDDMYLVLGDNRGDSLDSRDIGLIMKSDILGKVNLRIWLINKIRYVK
jgi:signal peptidase I